MKFATAIEKIKNFDIGVELNKLKKISFMDVMHGLRHFVIRNYKNVLIGSGAVLAIIIFLIFYKSHLDNVNEEANAMLNAAINYYNYTLRAKDLSLDDQKKYLKATLGTLQQLLGKYPGSSATPAALFYFGNALYTSQNYDEAIKQFKSLVKRFPHNYLAPYALENVGFSYEQKKDFTKALEFYDRILTDYPKNSLVGKVGLDKGRVYEAQNDLNKASESYRSVFTSAPNSVWARESQKRLGFLESKFKYMTSKIKQGK